MEVLKRKRTTLRSQVTKTINVGQAELEKGQPDIHVLQGVLETIINHEENLTAIDEQYMESLFVREDITDEQTESESASSDFYYIQIRTMKSRLNSAIRLRTEPTIQNSRSPSLTEASLYQFQKTAKLPKIELEKFSGELQDWLQWWAQFKRIHEDSQLRISDKFTYLCLSMGKGSDAESLVKQYQRTEENYPLVMEALQDRFGNPRLLRKFYVRRLLKFVMTKFPASKFRELVSQLEADLGSIEALGVCTDPHELLYPLIEACLPEEKYIAWQRSPNYETEGSGEDRKSDLTRLREFMKREANSEYDRVLYREPASKEDSLKSKPKIEKFHQKSFRETSTASSLAASTVDPCLFCKGNHATTECVRAQDMELDTKKEALKKGGACFICLKKKHSAKRCKTFIRCCLCKRRHHNLVCPEKGSESLNDQVKTMSREDKKPEEALSSNFANVTGSVFLKTVVVTVEGKNRKSAKVRMLIDEGSQYSYIKTSVAEKLKCAVVGRTQYRSASFGGNLSGMKTRNIHQVCLRGLHGQKLEQVELISDTVLAACPTIHAGPWLEELRKLNIHLTDTSTSGPEVQVVIGSDLRESMMTGNSVKLTCGLVAVETLLGWTLCGKVDSGQVQDKSQVKLSNTVARSYSSSIIASFTESQHRSLSDLWSLETIGIKDCPDPACVNEKDIEAKRKFQDLITRSFDGRYIVKFPWICESSNLPTNREVAYQRLQRVVQKLNDRGEYELYDNVFKQWLEEGLISVAPHATSMQGHYLPHRPVFKPDSVTTPVRPVFDASCKTKGYPSLNDCLEKGPNLLELIFSMIIRFREKKVGGIADIRKAFQMIEVSPEDRQFQKFLWYDQAGQEIMEYFHNRVVFGVNCSPFILASVLDYHLTNVSPEDKPVADQLLRCLYVDNAVFSTDTPEQFQHFKRTAVRIMADAKMDLRQWESNIDGEKGNQLASVLGIKWDKEDDQLFCHGLEINSEDTEKVSKRSVLSIVAQIFDPLGFLSPTVIQPKLQLQESWLKSKNWDKQWDPPEASKFRKWLAEVGYLSKIRVPRFAFQNPGEDVQIHCFCDASRGAYAAVIFSRIVRDGEVIVNFVASKTRLAPIPKTKVKRVSIPRLELTGCLIGVRLSNSILSALNRSRVRVFYWCDSTTALAWIYRDEDWGTFVGNRVREIRKSTSSEQWRHVPGRINPADLPSRGCSPKQLLESQWWEGPDWLRLPPPFWLDSVPEYEEEEIQSELRKTKSTFATSIVLSSPRFGSYLRNIRVYAWVRRFIARSRRCLVKSASSFAAEEIVQAEIDLLKILQRQHFFEPTRSGFQVKSDLQLKTLQVKLSEDGLLRVTTRLAYTGDPESFKNPILLPRKDPLVDQLVQHIHETHCHSGTQLTLSALRDRYWIIQGRRTVGNILRRCVKCQRYSAKPVEVVPAPLPEERVKDQYMFQTTGVDLAGPIILKHGKKAWIVLYTCALYRGVYLDLIESLSANEFLGSLEKFTQLFGRPSRIYSDNGTNFVGAQNLLSTLPWKKIEEQFGVKQIQWTFNPPAAPWYGGWWERLIRTVKDLLRKSLGSAKLTFRELESALAAVSYAINNRPLTVLNEDPNDMKPLTPAMFMKDLPVSGLPELEFVSAKDVQENYKKIQNLKRHLKERFRKEYISNLVQTGGGKSGSRSRRIQVNDIVLVGMDNKKKVDWPLGRVLQLYPGKDSHVRVAKLKTLQGILIRPLQRLYPLEMDSSTAKVLASPSLSVETSSPINTDRQDSEEKFYTRSGREVKRPCRLEE